uniref:NADH-ubiquinone oxidoreductase chain 2 n=1 Tax=Batophila aerata TaxID=877817 RepID=A0A3G1GRG8_9CUCU|nr:NADH dehydrogenase subunit 2 [Batophila aerata]
MITISAYTWFPTWIGLEINLLSIIPLFKSSNSKFPMEATLKYFITQTMASTMILFSLIMMLNLKNYFFSNYSFILILNSALLTKLGAAPFHSWFPEVTEGLNWNNNLLLLTWQKIAPSILISYNSNLTMFMSIIIMSCVIIGSIMGLNQTSLRKILAYSSINHLGWMLASLLNYQMIWLIYFFIYLIITSNIIIMFKIFNIFFITQLFLILNLNKMNKFMFSFNFLSLGGLPPFIGFIPKWFTINFLIQNNFFYLNFIMILFSLITLFFYLRLIFSSITIKTWENFILINNYNKFKFWFLSTLNILSLILCTNIFNFL